MLRMATKKAKRFVIQQHKREDAPLLRCASSCAKATEDRPKGRQVHWDLMLEAGEVLETYRINMPPEEWACQNIVAERILDHSVKFLSYEGSVNKGKGSVKIADGGTYEILREQEKSKKLSFCGNILKGEFALTHKDGNKWKLSRLDYFLRDGISGSI